MELIAFCYQNDIWWQKVHIAQCFYVTISRLAYRLFLRQNSDDIWWQIVHITQWFYVTFSRLTYRQYFLDRIGSNLEWSYMIMSCLTVLYFIFTLGSESLSILYFCVYKLMCLKQCTSLLKLDQITLYCTLMQWKKKSKGSFFKFWNVTWVFFLMFIVCIYKK